MDRFEWWKGCVIYQVYLRSFFDSDRDGVGDLAGLTSKLDYIASLGVDGIWISGPFVRSPQKDNGYDVEHYTEVEPIFGSLEDFDVFLAEAHRRSLTVLVDQVWSHTSDQHSWFHRSRHSRDNELSDWYVWADASPDGTPPNNWLSVFGGSAWTWEPRRRQFFLHHFLSAQPALNLHNPAVVAAILETGRFWLDRGVDGFRLDAIDFLTHDPALSSNPPAEPWGGVTPTKLFALQHHTHDMLHETRMDVLAQIRALLNEYPDTVALGEVSSQPGSFHRVMQYTTGSQHLHMAYTMSPLRTGFDWHHITMMLHSLHEAGETGWPCWSFSNHDIERSISRWNPKRGTAPPDPRFARLLAMLLLCLRGSVCLYQGEELGLSEACLTFDQLRDPFGIAYWPEFRGRDGSRTPIPWRHDLPHGAFTKGEHPWLPIPGDHYPLAVSVQEDDPDSLLNFWRHLLAYRREHIALIKGSLQPLKLPEPVIGFFRTHADEQLLCVFNLSEEPVTVTVPGVGDLNIAGYGYATQHPQFAESAVYV